MRRNVYIAVDALRQDLRYACRALLNRPGFSLLAVFTLAVGIGVNTVAFSAINGLFRKPMRFDGAEALGRVRSIGRENNAYGQMSLPDFQDLARESRAFEAVFAEARMPLGMTDAGGSGDRAPAEQLWSLLVSTNYLSAMRATPIAGRLFTSDDASGSELTAIASERFWNERLGGGPSLAGRTVTLNGRIFSIVGVIGDGFQGPGGLFEPQLWVPLERIDVLGVRPELLTRREQWLSVLGRMKPGVTAAQARADLQGVVAQLAAAHPATNAGRDVTFIPITELVPELKGIAAAAGIALAVVGLVLLIACFNVAGLMLARAAERQREMGVRAALGAGRGRILRQLVTEGLLLASISGVLSLLVSRWSAGLLSAFSLPSPIPQRLHIPFDARLVAFTFGTVVLAGVLPALLPALEAARTDLVRALRRESALGGRPSRARSAFVVAQVAGSTLFLATALLFARSFVNTASVSPGFDIRHTLVMEIDPATYGYDVERARMLFSALVDRVAGLGGVERAALADRVPFYVGFPKAVDIAASGEDCAVTNCRSAVAYGVSPGHFDALGIPLRAGRDLTEQEYRSQAPVAIVSEAMAAGLWPGADPIGRSMAVGRNGRRLQVIGVAATVTQHYMGEPPRWYLYRPLLTSEFGERLTMVIRTTGDPRRLMGAVQAQVQALDPALPIATLKSMEQRMELPLWPARTAAGFFLVCGTLALVLATVGLFGVTYFLVNQRRREFGVRVALGATSDNVMRLVIRDGLKLSVPGVAVGIVAALVVMRFAERALFGVSAADPLAYASTAGIQLLVALAACALPAWRAARVDPMIALRVE